MKLFFAGALAALSLAVTAPAMAQAVVIGPGGVGVRAGIHPYGYRRGPGVFVGRRPIFEGRSAYRGFHRGGVYRRF